MANRIFIPKMVDSPYIDADSLFVSSEEDQDEAFKTDIESLGTLSPVTTVGFEATATSNQIIPAGSSSIDIVFDNVIFSEGGGYDGNQYFTPVIGATYYISATLIFYGESPTYPWVYTDFLSIGVEYAIIDPFFGYKHIANGWIIKNVDDVDTHTAVVTLSQECLLTTNVVGAKIYVHAAIECLTQKLVVWTNDNSFTSRFSVIRIS